MKSGRGEELYPQVFASSVIFMRSKATDRSLHFLFSHSSGPIPVVLDGLINLTKLLFWRNMRSGKSMFPVKIMSQYPFYPLLPFLAESHLQLHVFYGHTVSWSLFSP